MIEYIILGILVVILLFVTGHSSVPKAVKYGAVFVSIIGFGWYVYGPTDRAFLGDEPWYETGPYRLIILYAVMVIGMAASLLAKAIADRRAKIAEIANQEERDKIKLAIDKYELAYPFLFSFMTFGALYQQVQNLGIGVVALTLAFQTGFFWDTVLKSLKPKVHS